jgi:hypothetical protein
LRTTARRMTPLSGCTFSTACGAMDLDSIR